MDLVKAEPMDINDGTVLIHIPSDMNEEHLDQIHTIQLLSTSQDDHEEQEEIHEELEITKVKVPKKRVSLTIEKKIEIIQRHEKGETQRSLSQEYNVGRTTISDILKRKYKFFKFMTMNADKEENLKRRRTLRRTVHKLLEDKLLEWYNESRAQGGYVSGPMISVKAQELHKELGYTDNFTASNGWLDRFKVRNGIKLCGLREVKTEVDANAVAPFKAELQSLANWYNLTMDQIYNADEADLFWKMLPNPDSDVNEVKSSVRAYRERMTVLCCTNATGSHKLPLVCIGRGKKSRTFTSQEIKTLPVNYYSQEVAWMDQEIFRDWFHSQFVPTVRQHLACQGLPETALLLIDRSTSHPSDQFLRSDDGFFFVQVLPPKVKSLIQPMEQGIISNMKRFYRRELLNDLVNRCVTIAEFQKGLTLKEAIRGIAKGWDAVSEETIRHCFSKIFPSVIENVQFDSTNETLICIEAFEKLVEQIAECDGYSRERIEKWLNCDEAEPQKDCNPFKNSNDTLTDLNEQSETQEEENLVFLDIHQEEHPETIEIVEASSHGPPESTILEQDSDDELLEDDQYSIVLDHESITSPTNQQHMETTVYEDTSNVTCRQALESLNVVLKYMKNEADSKYQDVVMLQNLKKSLRRKLSDLNGIRNETDCS